MGRILAIDYGSKRTGLAVTDPDRIIATPLTTVASYQVMDYLRDYLAAQSVERFVVGYPLHADGTPTDATPLVDEFILSLRRAFPQVTVETFDESFTSKRAQESMVTAGTRKKNRQKRSNLDVISATLILQSYLEDLNLSP